MGNTIADIQIGLDILAQLDKLYLARKSNPGLERIGSVMADVDALIGIYEKRFIEKVPYTDAEKQALLDYINNAPEVGIVTPPEPSAPTTPAPSDPTTVEYDTEFIAISKTTDAYPIVVQKANGKFVVWPFGVGPLPGAQVYPLISKP